MYYTCIVHVWYPARRGSVTRIRLRRVFRSHHVRNHTLQHQIPSVFAISGPRNGVGATGTEKSSKVDAFTIKLPIASGGRKFSENRAARGCSVRCSGQHIKSMVFLWKLTNWYRIRSTLHVLYTYNTDVIHVLYMYNTCIIHV